MPLPNLLPGEPAPWFYAKSQVNPRFCFDSMGGRFVVLSFFPSAADPAAQAFLGALEAARFLFDDVTGCFFGVTADPADEGRLRDQLPGVRFFYDGDLNVSRLYGAADPHAASTANYRPLTFILDERLRIVAVFDWPADPLEHVRQIMSALQALPAPAAPIRAQVQAPILVVPRIFEPEFCQTLIAYYEAQGGKESGFMRDVQGKTVEILDPNHKKRKDAEIEPEELRRACMIRIHDRLVPEIRKAYQFVASRIERYIVACYEAEAGGHFRAHRDNTTLGTAHRRFAVSLMLNSGEYEGGELRFPEFGRQLYTAPTGGAVVFSCSLLHEAAPVTRGRRYVFLPFLYDEAAARTRQENQRYVG
jgi:peroxiredoxin/predicted 2-oxoglutarate/Fe(II)-dependent dioxygenase YbiX